MLRSSWMDECLLRFSHRRANFDILKLEIKLILKRIFFVSSGVVVYWIVCSICCISCHSERIWNCAALSSQHFQLHVPLLDSPCVKIRLKKGSVFLTWLLLLQTAGEVNLLCAQPLGALCIWVQLCARHHESFYYCVQEISRSCVWGLELQYVSLACSALASAQSLEGILYLNLPWCSVHLIGAHLVSRLWPLLHKSLHWISEESSGALCVGLQGNPGRRYSRRAK